MNFSTGTALFHILSFFKASAFCLVTATGTSACDGDLVCMAFLFFVEGTGTCAAVHINGTASAAFSSG